MFIPYFFVSPETRRRQREEAEKRKKERLEEKFQPWHPKIKWEPRLNIAGSSFTPYRLFDTPPWTEYPNPNRVKPEFRLDSPGGKWRYVNLTVARGTTLHTWYGNKIGDVMFDSDVITPALYRYEGWSKSYRDNPIMSFTPAELISMRGGLRLAKGHTVVAGLGLGHLLLDVCSRRKVTKVTVVEIDRELADWVMPALKAPIAARGKPVEVIIGDAYQVLPKLTADVALVDIFDSYGSNDWDTNRIRSDSKNIGKVWGWGTAAVPDRYDTYW